MQLYQNDFPDNSDNPNNTGYRSEDFVWVNPPIEKLSEEQKQRGRQVIEDSLADWEEHTENF